MRQIQHSALPCVVHVTQPHAVYPQQIYMQLLQLAGYSILLFATPSFVLSHYNTIPFIFTNST